MTSEAEVIEIDTGFRPNVVQKGIFRNLKRFNVVVAHRRMGKTVFAVNALIDSAMAFPRNDGRFAYIAPYMNQARAIAWDYFKQYSHMIPGIKFHEQVATVEFPNGSKIRLFGADNADAMRGLFFDGAVLDEVADMRPHVWPEIVRPAMSDRLGWAIFIGTPKGVNLFSDLYFRGQDDKNWYCQSFPVSETGLIPDEELAAARKTMTENQYLQEFECDFNASVDNALIPLSVVLEATGKHRGLDEVEGSPKILGVDVARYGGDRCCIFPRQGLIAHKPKSWQGIDNMTFAGYVGAAIAKWEPDAVFIDAGRGEGVIDRLRQLGHRNIIEVNFGGKAGDPHYVNKRSEMWDQLRRWLEAGGSIPPTPGLKQDLTAPTYSYNNAANKFQLESKDKIKERGLPSPDLGDALALTFANPIVAKIKKVSQNGGNKYNPVIDRLKRG
jgi:hypothetical protein